MVKEGKEKQEATSQTQATKGGRPPSLAHRPWMGLLGRPCFLSTSPLLRVKTALTCGTLQLANVLPMWFLWMHTVPKPRESAPLARGDTGGQAGVRSQDKSRRPPPAEAHLENVWKNALWMGDSPPPPRRFLPHPGDGALWIPGPWVAAGSTSLPSASINAWFAGRGSRARACGHVQGCGVHSLVPGVWRVALPGVTAGLPQGSWSRGACEPEQSWQEQGRGRLMRARWGHTSPVGGTSWL